MFIAYDPAVPLLGTFQSEFHTNVHQKTLQKCSGQHYLWQTKAIKDPVAHQKKAND